LPDLVVAMEHVKESLVYLSSQLHRRGDLAGAARCALLLRHFFKDDISGRTHDQILHSAINKVVGGEQDYLFRGVDSLNTLLDQKLKRGSNHETGGAT
jgi:hypothetical protein